MPKGVRLKPEQIVAKLREIEVKIGQGKDVLSACREAAACKVPETVGADRRVSEKRQSSHNYSPPPEPLLLKIFKRKETEKAFPI